MRRSRAPRMSRAWRSRTIASPGLPLEPAAAIGLYDDVTGGYTLRAGSQGILIQKRALCGCFGVGDDKVRVICRDVGGGFGTKNLIYREYVLVCWAARKVGRPVKWRGERSEAFFFDPYGRDLVSTTELALDKDGKFLAIRTHNIQNLGSQTLHLVPLARGAAVTNGVYDIPAVYARLRRCSPTPRRPRPIAAPDGRKPSSSSSG